MKKMKILAVLLLVVGIMVCQSNLSIAKKPYESHEPHGPKKNYAVNQLVHNFNVAPDEVINAGDVVVITDVGVKASVGDANDIPVGIADANAVVGESVKVIIYGISTNYSDLEPGVEYYAGADGSLTTDPLGHKIGVAVSDTELLVRIGGRIPLPVKPPPIKP